MSRYMTRGSVAEVQSMVSTARRCCCTGTHCCVASSLVMTVPFLIVRPPIDTGPLHRHQDDRGDDPGLSAAALVGVSAERLKL